MNSTASISHYYKALTSVNSIAVLICMLAVGLVLCLSLYRQVIYRLALYQVLSSLALGVVEVSQVVFIDYDDTSKNYDRLCRTIGWLTLYFQWVKVLFTAWVTFHLFCFSVLYKNMKNFELLYVITSLLVPALIAAVPLTTDTYGPSPAGVGCFVFAKNNTGKDIDVALVERLSLWVGPAITILIATSVAGLVMVSKLTLQACRESNYDAPVVSSRQFWTAVKQLLPLSAFPALFFLFMIPELATDLSRAHNSTSKSEEELILVELVSAGVWSMASGLTLIIHIVVQRCCTRRKPYKLLRA